MADWLLEGSYMKNCNCDPGCPCDFNANPTHGNCEGMAAMIVEKGHFDGVSLDGAKFALKYWWPGALHEGHGAGQVILDASLSPEQMDALRNPRLDHRHDARPRRRRHRHRHRR